MLYDNLLLPEAIYKDHLEEVDGIKFTLREIDVIACTLEGMTAKEIAKFLSTKDKSLGDKGIESHKTNIRNKIISKFNGNLREFFERSGKYYDLKRYYLSLLLRKEFIKYLEKASILLKPYFISFLIVTKDYDSDSLLIKTLQHDLNILGKKVVKSTEYHFDITPTTIKNLDKQYIISLLSTQESFPFEKNTTPSNSNNELFDSTDDLKIVFLKQEPSNNIILSKWTANFRQKDFAQKENYYFLFLEILNQFFPQIDWEPLNQELIRKYNDLNQGIIACTTTNLNIKASTDNNGINSLVNANRSSNHYILYANIIFLIVFLALIIQRNLPNIPLIPGYSFSVNHSDVASYIPEILTAHEKFIGREEELKQIDDIFKGSNIAIISGRSGIGKTTLAIEYGKKNKASKVIRYFDADSQMKIASQYRELAEELGINVANYSQSILMRLVNNRLNKFSQEIIFIFDNVEKYEDVKDYLVNLPLRVKALITTRKPLLISDKMHIILNPFTEFEATEYIQYALKNRTLDKNIETQLLSTIGLLPFDIKLTAAYLLENPLLDMKEINTRINKELKDNLLINIVQHHDQISKNSWKLLQYSAYLDPDFIDLKIFKKLFRDDEKILSQAIKKIESLSLITIISNKQNLIGVRVHRELQREITRTVNNHPNYSVPPNEIWMQLIEVIEQLFPLVNKNPDSKWSDASNLKPHAKKLIDGSSNITNQNAKLKLTWLCYKLSIYHTDVIVDYPQALHYAQLALQGVQNISPPNITLQANIQYMVGNIYIMLGQPDKGINPLKHALELRQKLYKGNHPDIASTLNSLGVAYEDYGYVKEGLEYKKAALKMRQALYKGNHPEIAHSLAYVGIGYQELGDLNQALKYKEDALNMRKAIYHNNHLDIAESLSNVAWAYYKLKDFEKAIFYAKASADMNQELYPEGHIFIAYALETLGAALIEKGDAKEALDVLYKGLDMAQGFSTDNHFIIPFLYYHLGNAYLKLGNFQKALEHAQKAYSLRQELYADVKDHYEIIDSLRSLANIYEALGNKEKAASFFQDAQAMEQRMK